MPSSMRQRLDHGWRIFATGLSFALFGLGGLVLRLGFFPVLACCRWWTFLQRQVLARRIVHLSFRTFIGLMRALGVLDYEIHGRERLDRQGLLILANHPSLIDVVFLISLVPNATCVVKPAVMRNPFMRGAACSTGYLSNDSGAGLVEDCIQAVRSGQNLIIFPEGTRTSADGTLRLQRGAAQIAVRGLRDVTPVTIRLVPSSLTKGLPWWQVPERPMYFTIVVDSDIMVRPFLEQAGGSEPLAARQLTEHLKSHFQRGDLRDGNT